MSIQIEKPKIEHIQRWENAKRRVDASRKELNSAEVELSNSINNLGRILCPKDAQIDEAFHVWVEDKIIEVTKTDVNSYEVRYRR